MGRATPHWTQPGAVAIRGPAPIPGHPACPEEWTHDQGWLRLPIHDTAAVRLEPGPVTRRKMAPAALLEGRGMRVRKALKRAGLKHINRWMDRPIELASPVGPTLGGWVQGYVQGGRPVALDWSLAAMEGWQVWDHEALGLPVDPALKTTRDVCALWFALHADSADLPAIWDDLQRPDPGRVTVRVVGPDWLDTRRWDGPVGAQRARALIHALDGVSCGGQPLQVRTEPALRPGRRPPPREDRSVRRRRLFSRWDQGIRVDDEGLWSITPEALADHAVRGLTGHVLDGTCGVGSLAIAAARAGCTVTACDLSASRLAMAEHNASLYGVRLNTVRADVRQLLASGDFDALILDPPWGGVDYDRDRMTPDRLPFPLLQVLERAPRTVRLKLPRSFAVETLPGFTWSAAVDARDQLKFLLGSR
jgi:trimethylguanosine synthase